MIGQPSIKFISSFAIQGKGHLELGTFLLIYLIDEDMITD